MNECILLIVAEKGFVPKEFLSDKQPSSGVSQKTFDPFEWLDPAGHSEKKSSKANDDIFLVRNASVIACLCYY